MQKAIKRCVLFILTLLPIASISFAAQAAYRLDGIHQDGGLPAKDKDHGGAASGG